MTANVRKTNLQDCSYKEFIESSSSYNKKLVRERKFRLPFLDSQTGVAQSDCYLWVQKSDRQPKRGAGQLYSYPARRWRKRRRQYLLNDNYLRFRSKASTSASHETNDYSHNSINDTHQDHHNQDSSSANDTLNQDSSFMHDSSSNSNAALNNNNNNNNNNNSNYSKIDPDGSTSEGTIVHDDLETTITTPKKKTERKTNNGTSKPFKCELCGQSYKTRPGLSYHKNHCHASNVTVCLRNSSTHCITSNGDSTINNDDPSNSKNTDTNSSSSPASSQTGNHLYCDFCLGDAKENRTTRKPEELISCSECGRSAHPTCLKFKGTNIIISVKKYKWQCIECKSCVLCGKSDNDDQLLFCDDCDRGYHMYCLDPPLTKAPDDSWSCSLCLEEYYGAH